MSQDNGNNNAMDQDEPERAPPRDNQEGRQRFMTLETQVQEMRDAMETLRLQQIGNQATINQQAQVIND
jgi:hypothetical protein